MATKSKPICFVIAGPNGVGKTTFAMQFLPEIAGCRNFINVDNIAYAFSPFDSLAAQYEAGKIFLSRIQENIKSRNDFAFETTLSGKTHLSLLKKLKNTDWRIQMFFVMIIQLSTPSRCLNSLEKLCVYIKKKYIERF